MKKPTFYPTLYNNRHSCESRNPQLRQSGFRIKCGMTYPKITVGKVGIVLVGCIAILITGCGPKEPPSVKQSRAIAAENIELRKQVERLNLEIESLKEQHEKEIKKQEKLLTQCEQDNDALKKKAQQNIRSQVAPVLDAVIDGTAKLREENAKLKGQIEQLQKEADK